MKLVLDASAAIRLVTGAASNEIAAAVQRADEVLAPDLFVSEVANALWRIAKQQSLSTEEAVAALDLACSLPDTLVPVATIRREVLAEAMRLAHPAYDLAYLVLARREVASLATVDKRLAALADEVGLETAM